MTLPVATNAVVPDGNRTWIARLSAVILIATTLSPFASTVVAVPLRFSSRQACLYERRRSRRQQDLDCPFVRSHSHCNDVVALCKYCRRRSAEILVEVDLDRRGGRHPGKRCIRCLPTRYSGVTAIDPAGLSLRLTEPLRLNPALAQRKCSSGLRGRGHFEDSAADRNGLVPEHESRFGRERRSGLLTGGNGCTAARELIGE